MRARKEVRGYGRVGVWGLGVGVGVGIGIGVEGSRTERPEATEQAKSYSFSYSFSKSGPLAERPINEAPRQSEATTLPTM